MLRIAVVCFIMASLSCSGKCGYNSLDFLEFSESSITNGREFGIKEGQEYEVNSVIDLKGMTLKLPKDVVLRFNGGILKNGVIEGYDTKIECKKNAFERVRIKGTWLVPTIKSSLFKDLNYLNSIKDVVALSNPKIKNIIRIEKGEYWVYADKNDEKSVVINDNTTLILKGTIRMVPNKYPSYNIIYINGKNIIVKGGGVVIGDKETHTGDYGDWGMGIFIGGSNNVEVSELSIKDCWGDCIYVGYKSRNVCINNCKLDNGRRQGISITSANNVIIKNCAITNIKGTAPECAIDVEPNKGDSVDNVTIDKIKARDCRGGILIYGEAEKASIGEIAINNTKILPTFKYPLKIRGCKTVSINNSEIDMSNNDKSIECHAIGMLKVTNSKFAIKRHRSLFTNPSSCRDFDLFQIEGCKSYILKSNSIFEM